MSAQLVPGHVARGPGWELRLGDYREVLADVTCDALITDPPYSARTHENLHTGWLPGGDGYGYECAPIPYARWTPGEARSYVRAWSNRVSGWIVVMSDHVLMPHYEHELSRLGRYAFPPTPFVEMGKQPRVNGDGPASWTCWLAVARPRSREWLEARKVKRDKRGDSGSLPGAYVLEGGQGHQSDRVIKGGKPLWLMRAIVRDYSEPGDLVCDPCAGGGTTLLAAVTEGRRAIGAERDPETWRKAVKRLERGYTPCFDFGGAA